MKIINTTGVLKFIQQRLSVYSKSLQLMNKTPVVFIIFIYLNDIYNCIFCRFMYKEMSSPVPLIKSMRYA